MDHRAYWVWLQHAFGVGSALPWQLHRRFRGGVEEFCRGGPRLWNTLTFLTDNQAAALHNFTLEEAQVRLDYALGMGWQVLTPECEKYPDLLRNISDPPAVLYVKGTLPDLDSGPSIGVAGARKALDFSLQAARTLGYQLAAGGAPVISGGAVGIDSAALSGAMSAMGRVVSVLPVDLSSTYLARNARLRQDILRQGGALVSEYCMQSTPVQGAFQIRNRLITGLSCGVVLIQAKKKSGTMIYASHAAAQNRDVFVLPGPPESPEFAGSRQLLQEGAKAVTCGEDVLEEYTLRFSSPKPRVVPRATQPPRVIGFPREESVPALALADSGVQDVSLAGTPADKVWAALALEALPVPVIAQRTGLSTGQVLSVLTELELSGKVEALPGRQYRRGRG